MSKTAVTWFPCRRPLCVHDETEDWYRCILSRYTPRGMFTARPVMESCMALHLCNSGASGGVPVLS